MKFETVRIHFLSDAFSLLSCRNFATMATWRNDFSSQKAIFRWSVTWHKPQCWNARKALLPKRQLRQTFLAFRHGGFGPRDRPSEKVPLKKSHFLGISRELVVCIRRVLLHMKNMKRQTDRLTARRWRSKQKNKTKKIYIKANCPIFRFEKKPSSGAKWKMEIKLKVRYK